MRVGAHIEIDRAVFSKDNNGILKKSKNDQKVGLIVVVDLLSNYCDAEAYTTGYVEDTAALTKKILTRMSKKMKLRGGKCFTDSGAEFLGPSGNRSNAFVDMVTKFGMSYNALPTKHTAPHVEAKNGDIRRNINSMLAKSKKKRWVDIYREVITGLNNSSFTDHRAGLTPAEIVKMSPKEQKKLGWEHKKKKGTRNAKLKGARMKELEPGQYVRIALKPKIKGAEMG